jgi:hypothetical protein
MNLDDAAIARHVELANNLLSANRENLIALGKLAIERYPLPPISAALEEMSGGQLSKLLTETQKLAFVAGILVILVAVEGEISEPAEVTVQ